MRYRMAVGLLLVVILSMSVSFPIHPHVAAAASKDDNTALAEYLPADTILYANIRTADIDKNLDFLTGLISSLSGGAPAGLYKQMLYQQLEQGLTQLLGRKITLAKDIMPWLGNHIAVGFILSDEDASSLLSGSSTAQRLVLLFSVKDQTAGDAFMSEFLSRLKKTDPTGKVSSMEVNGSAATVYADSQIGIVQASGLIALGMPDGIDAMVDGLKAKRPTLATDPGFVNTMKLLQPNNLINLFLSHRLYTLIFDYAESSPMFSPSSGSISEVQFTALKGIFSAMDGQAYGAGIDNKTLRLDIVQSYKWDEMRPAFVSLSGIDTNDIKLPALPSTWADQVPADALFVIGGFGGLNSIYQDIKTLADRMKTTTPGAPADQMQQSINQIEGSLRALLNVKPQEDMFSWMTGDFALYLTYNADSIFNTQAGLSSSSNAFPFDVVFTVKSGDTQKTLGFIDKLNIGLKVQKDVVVKDEGNNMYTLGGQNFTGGLSYGLVDKTFILASSTGIKGAVDALNSKNPLSASTAWKNAQKSALTESAFVVFADSEQMLTAAKNSIPASQLNSPSTQQTLDALAALESFTIYAAVDNTRSSISIQVNIK